MNNPVTDTSQRLAAIVTGISLIVMTVAAVVATELVFNQLVVPGDAAATTRNIQNAQSLFRIGVFCCLVVLVCDVLVAWGLYVYLKPVNPSLSLLTAWLRLVYAAMLGSALLNPVSVLTLMDSASSESMGGMASQVLLLLESFDAMWSMALIVFGIHILLLGYLVYRSGYVPKIFGILLFLAFVGYVMIHSVKLLALGEEDYLVIMEWIFIPPMVAGELGLAIWLLLKGVSIKPGLQH